MTDKEIVQEMEGGNERIELCDIEEYIHMLLGQYQDNPIQLKKIIGGKLFNEIKFRYNRK